ncbi:MAG: hydroxypyruvate isomerase [Bacteroidetes bacterium]|nr:MAG: hydroxypyruvate isomerase [Bacteroidota bacterium]
MSPNMSRTEAIRLLAAASAGLIMPLSLSATPETDKSTPMTPLPLKGNVNHSACRWCYGGIPLDELCVAAKEMGLKGIDLLNPPEWKTAIGHGLAVSMSFGSPLGITKGFNDPSLHKQLQKDYAELIPKAAEAGVKNVICFSGNRNGITEQAGLDNCARGLEASVKLAEKHGVILMMELLNSKVDHADYQCDHTPWGVQLAEKLGSPNFKLLYDIYHMQIMEGDVIATIRKYHPYIGHYHTGGVPGRHEIDESQELYYPAIIKAVLETGYKGFVAQEFIPAGKDPLASLRQGVSICDV